MKKFFICLLSVILVLNCFSSCTKNPNTNEDTTDISGLGNGLAIVTTIFPVYDWVKNILGSDKNLVYLDENGIDLHSFEPTANDIITLSKADIFICIGGESDEWVDNAVNSAANPDLTVIKLMEVTGVLEEETVEGMETEHKETNITDYDEHVWLSLKKAQIAVEHITSVLCSLDADNGESYKTNAENYIKELKALDAKFSAVTESALGNTLLFADRFPFRYFVEDYGIEYYAAFPGCSAESEASFETIAFLIEKTNELQLDTVIVLEGSDGKLASAVSAETGAKIQTLNSCQSVTKENVSDGATYISIMESNLTIITEALG